MRKASRKNNLRAGVRKTSKKNPRIVLLGLVGVVIVAGLVVAVMFVFKGDSEKKKEAEQTTYVAGAGREFYTELFYKQLAEGRSKEELKNFLKKYEETGINTSLDNLSRTAGKENKKKVEKLLSNEHKCDKEKTKVFIYPKAPYGKDDYTIEVKLACGDKKKDDTKDKNKDKDGPIEEKKNGKKK